jgi:hypothetical protein
VATFARELGPDDRLYMLEVNYAWTGNWGLRIPK